MIKIMTTAIYIFELIPFSIKWYNIFYSPIKDSELLSFMTDWFLLYILTIYFFESYIYSAN